MSGSGTKKEITVNQKPRNSESWNGGGHQHAAGTRTGFLPEIIQTPFRAREALLLARFLVPQSHFIPPHTASSRQIKPSVSVTGAPCRDQTIRHDERWNVQNHPPCNVPSVSKLLNNDRRLRSPPREPMARFLGPHPSPPLGMVKPKRACFFD